MTKLKWEEVYDPNGGEYKVPPKINSVIGGGPYGGATLLPSSGMANPEMEATFKDIIAKIKPTNGTTGTNSTTASTSPPSGDISDSVAKERSILGGEIAGIVVGAFVGISLIVLGILCLLKRLKARVRGTDPSRPDGHPPAEMPTPLAPQAIPISSSIITTEMPTPLVPQELHPHGLVPHAQELHAYMPNEMASAIDQGNMAPHIQELHAYLPNEMAPAIDEGCMEPELVKLEPSVGEPR